MTKEVDVLVVTGYAHMIVEKVPQGVYRDVSQGLWYVRNGKTQWYDGAAITEQDKNNLFSGEVFLQLGALSTSRYLRRIVTDTYEWNPCREAAVQVLDSISPLEPGEKLPSSLMVGNGNAAPITQILPNMFTDILEAYPSFEDELLTKWIQAQAVYAARGTKEVMAYDVDSLIQGFRELKLDEIVPDSVQFDQDLTVSSQAYDVAGLVGHMGLQPRPRMLPYYEMCHDMQTEGAEVLAHALEDLQLVSEAIKS